MIIMYLMDKNKIQVNDKELYVTIKMQICSINPQLLIIRGKERCLPLNVYWATTTIWILAVLPDATMCVVYTKTKWLCVTCISTIMR